MTTEIEQGPGGKALRARAVRCGNLPNMWSGDLGLGLLALVVVLVVGVAVLLILAILVIGFAVVRSEYRRPPLDGVDESTNT